MLNSTASYLNVDSATSELESMGSAERQLATHLATAETLEHLARSVENSIGILGVFSARPSLWQAYCKRFAAGARSRRAPERTIDAELDMLEALFRLLTGEQRHHGKANARWLVKLGVACGVPWLQGELGRSRSRRAGPVESAPQIGAPESTDDAPLSALGASVAPMQVGSLLSLQEVLDASAYAGLRGQLCMLNATLLVASAPGSFSSDAVRGLVDDTHGWLHASPSPALTGKHAFSRHLPLAPKIEYQS